MSSIVYIDDEPTVCRITGRILARVDAEVHTFTDPGKAIDFINANPPTLVICDYRLQKVDGLMVRSKITVDVPFVLISGDLSVDEIQRDDITDVLQKPVRPETLIAFVARYL